MNFKLIAVTELSELEVETDVPLLIYTQLERQGLIRAALSQDSDEG